MPSCNTCGDSFETLRSLKRHYNREHSGEIWTPDEHLGGIESDQKDLSGDDPEPEHSTPTREYMTDESGGGSVEEKSRRSSLFEFERDEEPLTEYENETENGDDSE